MVGMSFFANCAYAAASYQLTPPTGRLAVPVANVPPSHVADPGRLVRSTKRATAASYVSARHARSTKGCFHKARFAYPPESTKALHCALEISNRSIRKSPNATGVAASDPTRNPGG